MRRRGPRAFVLPSACLTANRKRNGERRSPARRALEADRAAVQLDEALGQRESQPRAFRLAQVIVPNLPELLEYQRLVLGRDADACVAHGDLDVPGAVLRHYVHPPA